MTSMWPEPVRNAAAAVGEFFRPARVVASRIWRRFFRGWVLALVGLFPFTRTGVAFLALFSAAVYVYGLLARDLVLLVAGLGGGLILLVLLLATSLGALLLFLRTRAAVTPGELDLDTAVPQPTGYRVGALRGIPFIVVDWQWVDDGGGETAAYVELERQGSQLVELASPYRRRIVNRVVRRFAVRDLFGLTEIS